MLYVYDDSNTSKSKSKYLTLFNKLNPILKMQNHVKLLFKTFFQSSFLKRCGECPRHDEPKTRMSKSILSKPNYENASSLLIQPCQLLCQDDIACEKETSKTFSHLIFQSRLLVWLANSTSSFWLMSRNLFLRFTF